jgi:hypothetical protein
VSKFTGMSSRFALAGFDVKLRPLNRFLGGVTIMKFGY